MYNNAVRARLSMDDDELADLTKRFGEGVWLDAACMLIADLPPGREKSLVLTNLEQAQLWAQKAVRVQPK